MSLISRHLEENGVATIVIATARDIVEFCGVARLLFVDFPLGSPCGEPWDVGQQRELFQQGLDLLETATEPRSIKEAGYSWSKGEEWKRLVFTAEQPYQDKNAKAIWNDRKDEYRRLKKEGKL